MTARWADGPMDRRAAPAAARAATEPAGRDVRVERRAQRRRQLGDDRGIGETDRIDAVGAGRGVATTAGQHVGDRVGPLAAVEQRVDPGVDDDVDTGGRGGGADRRDPLGEGAGLDLLARPAMVGVLDVAANGTRVEQALDELGGPTRSRLRCRR
jgi:hypothetical protein